MDDARRTQILSGAGYVTGVAGAVAPRLLAKAFGVRESNGELESMVRMMSFRNVALAAALTAVADDDRLRKSFFTIAAAMFAADTAAAVAGLVRGKVSVRSAVMLGSTTGALAAIAASGTGS